MRLFESYGSSAASDGSNDAKSRSRANSGIASSRAPPPPPASSPSPSPSGAPTSYMVEFDQRAARATRVRARDVRKAAFDVARRHLAGAARWSNSTM